MTLYDTIQAIERVAAQQPAVKMIVRNDIFRLNSVPSALYGVFGWLQREHSAAIDSNFFQFSFTFFYVDRLNEDRSNETEIQSVGVRTLDNIIRTLDASGVYPGGVWTFTTFNQRFTDECAGVFTNVALQVPLGGNCEETLPDYSGDFNSDFLIY